MTNNVSGTSRSLAEIIREQEAEQGRESLQEVFGGDDDVSHVDTGDSRLFEVADPAVAEINPFKDYEIAFLVVDGQVSITSLHKKTRWR